MQGNYVLHQQGEICVQGLESHCTAAWLETSSYSTEDKWESTGLFGMNDQGLCLPTIPLHTRDYHGLKICYPNCGSLQGHPNVKGSGVILKYGSDISLSNRESSILEIQASSQQQSPICACTNKKVPTGSILVDFFFLYSILMSTLLPNFCFQQTQTKNCTLSSYKTLYSWIEL